MAEITNLSFQDTQNLVVFGLQQIHKLNNNRQSRVPLGVCHNGTILKNAVKNIHGTLHKRESQLTLRHGFLTNLPF